MATLSSIITPSNITTATNTQTLTNKTLTGAVMNGTLGATTPSTGAFTTVSATGNLNFTGTSNRITGDFSNATPANRVSFQTSTANGSTLLNVLPNGTGTSTSLVLINASDPTNCSFAQFGASGSTEVLLNSGAVGTGTFLPMTFYTNGSERMRITTAGVVAVGVTNATCAGSAVAGVNIGGNSLASSLGLGINSTNDSGTQYFVGFGRNGSICGQIYSTTTNSTTYATSSDARLKEDVQPFTDSGKLIDALQPRSWQWKQDGSFGLGFVAQEQHAADPIFEQIGAVLVGDDNAVIEKQWMRSDQPLVPILVAELKSVRARLAALESK
jgi:hypothetical protein